MKSKAVIPLVFGLVVGVIAIKYTMDAVKRAQGASTESELIQVIVARQDIPSTAAITPDMLVVTQTPKTPLLPPDTYAKLEDLSGRVALKSIPQGAPVLPSMIAPKGTLPGLLVRVKDGYRAVAVKIDESSGVGYLVNPNDWVDVLAVMEVSKGRKTDTISKVVLERVQVGAVGQILNGGPEDSGSGNSNSHAKTVTLLVKVEDVPKLHLAQTRGRITLAMRGNDDTQIVGTESLDEEAGDKPADSSLLAKLWKSATTRPVDAAEPVEAVETTSVDDQSHTHTVAVVNSTAAGDDGMAVKHITFLNDQSMEVVSTDAGMAPGPRYHRPPVAPRGMGATPAATQQPTRQENEEESEEFKPNEVTD
jgi:pilus assembly protein CpaB